MTTTRETGIFAYGRNGPITVDEYEAINAALDAAEEHGDEVEIKRLPPQIPMVPHVLRAFAKIYGKQAILQHDFDLTEANMKYGEGWLDEF